MIITRYKYNKLLILFLIIENLIELNNKNGIVKFYDIMILILVYINITHNLIMKIFIILIYLLVFLFKLTKFYIHLIFFAVCIH